MVTIVCPSSDFSQKGDEKQLSVDVNDQNMILSGVLVGVDFQGLCLSPCTAINIMNASCLDKS